MHSPETPELHQKSPGAEIQSNIVGGLPHAALPRTTPPASGGPTAPHGGGKNIVNTLASGSEAHNRREFGESDMKQMRDFLNDRGICCLDFFRKRINLFKISENTW